MPKGMNRIEWVYDDEILHRTKLLFKLLRSWVFDHLISYISETCWVAFCNIPGTFLCNNEGERRAAKLKSKTISLWWVVHVFIFYCCYWRSSFVVHFPLYPFHRSYLNQPDILKPLLNPMYEPNNSVLWPSVASQSLVSVNVCIVVGE